MVQTGCTAFTGDHAGNRCLDLSTTLTNTHLRLLTFWYCHFMTRFLLLINYITPQAPKHQALPKETPVPRAHMRTVPH